MRVPLTSSRKSSVAFFTTHRVPIRHYYQIRDDNLAQGENKANRIFYNLHEAGQIIVWEGKKHGKDH